MELEYLVFVCVKVLSKGLVKWLLCGAPVSGWSLLSGFKEFTSCHEKINVNRV